MHIIIIYGVKKWKSEKPRLFVMRKLGSINRSPGKGFPPGTIMIMPTTAHDDDDGSWWRWRWRWQWWLEVQPIPVAILSTLNSSRPGLLLQTYVALCPLMTLVMMILKLKLEVLLQWKSSSLLFFIQAPTWDPLKKVLSLLHLPLEGLQTKFDFTRPSTEQGIQRAAKRWVNW